MSLRPKPPASSAGMQPGTPRSAHADARARVRAGADPGVAARTLVAQMTLEEQLGCLDGDTEFWAGDPASLVVDVEAMAAR